MITGQVAPNGVPWIELQVAGQTWRAVIDTGFNGYLELPLSLQTQLNAKFVGRVTSALAGGQRLEEDVYLVDFPFDGQLVRASATFVDERQILVGTRLLRDYELTVNFVERSVVLQVVAQKEAN